MGAPSSTSTELGPLETRGFHCTTVMTPTACTTGFTSTAFAAIGSGGWVDCSARGIGINNSGRPCSIRGSEGRGPPEQGAGPHGRAYSCAYDSTRERVSRWFR